MKCMRLLAVVVLVSACSSGQQTPPPQPEPEAAAAGTAGTGKGEPAAKAEPAEPRPAAPPRATEAKDAKAAATGPVAEAARRDGVNVDAAVLQSFNVRIQRYLDIHKDAAKSSGKLKETEKPEEITAAQEVLARMHRHHSIDYAQAVAARHAARAATLFESTLDFIPESQDKAVLRQIIHYVNTRLL